MCHRLPRHGLFGAIVVGAIAASFSVEERQAATASPGRTQVVRLGTGTIRRTYRGTVVVGDDLDV